MRAYIRSSLGMKIKYIEEIKKNMNMVAHENRQYKPFVYLCNMVTN